MRLVWSAAGTQPCLTVCESQASHADALASRCCKSGSGDLLERAHGRRVGARFWGTSTAAWLDHRLDQSQFLKVLRSEHRPRPWRCSADRAARHISNGPFDQRKRIARGCRYAAAMKIFFAARARAKKFFFLLDAVRRVARGCAQFGLIAERRHA